MTVPYQTIQVVAKSLENNLLGDSCARQVLILLPPSYYSEPSKYYPVIYVLHRFAGSAKEWFSVDYLDSRLDQTYLALLAEHKMQEVIFVLPENNTIATCCGYNNSEIQGNWLDFFCDDLIVAVESQYRCIGTMQSRAIIGHHSGGDACLRLAMKKPGVFKHFFAISCTQLYPKDSDWLVELYTTHFQQILDVQQGIDDISHLDVYAHMILGLAQQAFPDSNNPPLYFQFPIKDQHWEQLNTLYGVALFAQFKGNLVNVNLAMDASKQELAYSKIKKFAHTLNQQSIKVDWFECDAEYKDHMTVSLRYALPWLSDKLGNPNKDQ